MKRISDLYKDIDNIISENEYHDDDTRRGCLRDIRGRGLPNNHHTE